MVQNQFSISVPIIINWCACGVEKISQFKLEFELEIEFEFESRSPKRNWNWNVFITEELEVESCLAHSKLELQ